MNDTGNTSVKFECKLCGETFEGDRWEPEYPDGDCPDHADGQHIWAEEADDYV